MVIRWCEVANNSLLWEEVFPICLVKRKRLCYNGSIKSWPTAADSSREICKVFYSPCYEEDIL